eukprot:PhM_4_TR16822/c1_g1_i2/m.47812
MRKIHALNIMRRVGAERVKAHNFALAESFEPGFLHTYGNRLMTYPLPILVNKPELRALNIKLLTDTATVSGGGAHQPSSIYRTRTAADDLAPALEGGEYYAPVVHDGQGSAAIDLSELQNFLVNMAHNIPRGRGQGNNRGRGGQGFGNRGGRKSGYQNNSNNSNNNNNSRSNGANVNNAAKPAESGTDNATKAPTAGF